MNPVLCIWLPGLLLLLSSSVSPVRFQRTNPSVAKSRLVLFKGEERFELEGKNCPVGISFTKPERLSCACVTGVWAFYDEWCAEPFKIIGGLNHCFEMTNNWVQQVTLWSNPIRVLDGSLTIFDGDEEYIKAKIYRNTHITVRNVSTIVTHNSSWTLTNQQTGTRLCLNSKMGSDSRFDRFAPEPEASSIYCHFSELEKYFTEINAFKPGCAGKDIKLEPARCQYYEDTNDESFCTSTQILENYANALEADSSSGIEGLNQTVRTFRKRIRTTVPPSTATEEIQSSTTPPNRLQFDGALYDKEWEPNRLGLREKHSAVYPQLPQLFLDFPDYSGNPIANQGSGPGSSLAAGALPSSGIGDKTLIIDFLPDDYEDEDRSKNTLEMLAELAKINETEWLTPAKSDSDPFFLIQMWMYQKQAILNSLNLKREEELVQHSNQVRSLLDLSKQIMQVTCGELISPEFFTMAMEAFLNVQSKNLHWKPPFVDHADFLRIQASLQNCLSRADKFSFKSTDGCLIKDPKHVFVNGVVKPLVVPERLNSSGFEPIIETMWKVVVNAHSYCYSDFSESYNDHHRYTVILTPVFTNGIHDIWYRNKTLQEEYSGVTGRIGLFLREIDHCTVSSRYVSAYPWDLTRPIVGTEEERRRRKRSLRTNKPIVLKPTRDPKIVAFEKMGAENAAWKESRLVLRGLGYCLKKFDEPRLRLGQVCEAEE